MRSLAVESAYKDMQNLTNEYQSPNVELLEETNVLKTNVNLKQKSPAMKMPLKSPAMKMPVRTLQTQNIAPLKTKDVSYQKEDDIKMAFPTLLVQDRKGRAKVIS